MSDIQFSVGNDELNKYMRAGFNIQINSLQNMDKLPEHEDDLVILIESACHPKNFSHIRSIWAVKKLS